MTFEETIRRIREKIDRSQTICVFTGAGISCPSGIPDFRSADGLYRRGGAGRVPPEEILSHSFFMNHCEEFYDFYRKNLLYLSARPNPAHLYFAALEKRGKRIPVVTQNIDGLHQAAGSADVIELHGSVWRNFCMTCGKPFDVRKIAESSGIPRCDADGGIIRPDVVLYEEPLDEYATRRALEAISGADLLFVVGTSLAVYPANSYIRAFRGDSLILINRSETPYDTIADIAVCDDIVHVVESLEKAESDSRG